MGREIKLRVWDKEDKKFLEPCFESEEDRFNKGMAMIRWNSEGKIWFTLSGYRDDDGNPYQIDAEITEYTGVNDKNGRGVYTGDIVSVWRDGSHRIFTVQWRAEGVPMYILYPQPLNEDFWHLRSDMEMSWEVIGNIYDNPELLQEVE